MADRPDRFPEWATTLTNDPTSLQDNRVEPSAGQKITGIVRGAFQPRQWTNWLFWLINEWIEYFDTSLNQFGPHEAAAPDMTVILSAGRVQSGVTLTSVAEQITAAFVAPAGNPRIDRIVIDNVTGIHSVIAGTEAASPVAPALTVGKIAICQILLDNSPATTEITNGLITDERASNPFPAGLELTSPVISTPTIDSRDYTNISELQRSSVQATTSGSSVDFTSIPSWAKKITIAFDDVGANGTTDLLLQLGDSGGIETSGYKYVKTKCFSSTISTGGGSGVTNWAVFSLGLTADKATGLVTLINIDSDTWVFESKLSSIVVAPIQLDIASGVKTLSLKLDRLRVSLSSGTFDDGQINVFYEG